jgi:hypothetical protein
MEEILEFLDKAERAGRSIPAMIAPQIDLGQSSFEENKNRTVAYEARQLKMLFLKLAST